MPARLVFEELDFQADETSGFDLGPLVSIKELLLRFGRQRHGSGIGSHRDGVVGG